MSEKIFEEAYLSFNYKGIIRRTITVYYHGDFYIPLREVFEELLINFQIDKEREIVKGFYIYPDDEYEIDFRNFTFKRSEVEFMFSESDLIKTELDYYFKSDFFSRAFNLSFSIDLRNLALWLWPKIWQGNRDQIEDPDVIQPGQKLKIPKGNELNDEEKAAARKYYRPKAAAPAPPPAGG